MMSTEHRTYQGPERRRYRMFVTRNSEYHCRDGICIAVRNRTTGEFVDKHGAIGCRMSSSIRFGPDGEICGIAGPEDVQIGDQLCFHDEASEEGSDVITSTLRSVERPPKDLVVRYLH